MKKLIKILIVISFFAVNFNIYANNITITSNTNWSAITGGSGTGGLPGSADAITVQNGATLTVNVNNAVCQSVQIGTAFNGTGTLTFNSGSQLTVSGDVTLGQWLVVGNSGSLNMTNGGVLNIGGSFTTVILGTFTPGSGTIAYNGSAVQTILSSSSLGNIAYNNLTLSGSGAKTTTGAKVNGILSMEGTATATGTSPSFGSSSFLQYKGTALQTPSSVEFPSTNGPNSLTINNSNGVSFPASFSKTIAGTLTLTSGALSLGANTLTLNGGITLGTGTITGSSSTNLIINGTGNMTLPSISGGLSSLTLNRGNSSIVTLNSNVTVYNTLTFSTTSGNISTGTNTLTLGDATTGMGTFTDNAGATTGVITGKFARYFTTTINSSPILFPVGDVSANSSPRTASIKFTTAPTTAGTLTAQYITGDAGNANTGPLTDVSPTYTVNTYSHAGYWQIDAGTLAGGNYTIVISPVGFTGMSVYANLRILKRPSSGGVWTLQGTQVPGTSAPTASRSSISGFSQFALGGNTIDNPLDGPLPVELTTFSANTIDRDIRLNWVTATEQNNSGFELQRQNSVSNNQYSNWEKIGFIKGSGTKSTPTNYSYNDIKLNTGNYKYRLKQIDYNGNFEYFNLNSEIVIGTPNKFDISQNYPNPFNPTTKIDYNLPFESQVSIKVYDVSGREVKTLVNETKQAGYYTVDFSGNDFASGMYFYRITAENNGQKIVMMKKMLMIK